MIIAIVPSPGHEALVAEGPPVDGCVPERPMTRYIREDCVVCGLDWHDACRCDGEPDHREVRALVLHAPGDPRLGMLRALGAAGVGRILGATAYKGRLDVAWYDTDGVYGQCLGIPCPPEWDGAVDFPLALAHLLVQRGIAAEVIVLPADKAKE